MDAYIEVKDVQKYKDMNDKTIEKMHIAYKVQKDKVIAFIRGNIESLGGRYELNETIYTVDPTSEVYDEDDQYGSIEIAKVEVTKDRVWFFEPDEVIERGLKDGCRRMGFIHPAESFDLETLMAVAEEIRRI